MSKDRRVQVDADSFAEGLALAFVDGHGPSEPHWELVPSHSKWQVCVFGGVATNARKRDIVALLRAGEDQYFQKTSALLEHHHSRAFADSQERSVVADDHEDSSVAQEQLVGGKPPVSMEFRISTG